MTNTNYRTCPRCKKISHIRSGSICPHCDTQINIDPTLRAQIKKTNYEPPNPHTLRDRLEKTHVSPSLGDIAFTVLVVAVAFLGLYIVDYLDPTITPFLFFMFIGVIFWFVALVDLLRNDFSGNNKLIWLLVIIFVPIIGLILYSFMSSNHKINRSL